MHSIMDSSVAVRAARHVMLVALMVVASVVAAAASVPVAPVALARGIGVADPTPETVRKTHVPAPMPIRPTVTTDAAAWLMESMHNGVARVRMMLRI
jgi:hypothetical protein